MRGMGLSGAVAYRGGPAGYTCAMRTRRPRPAAPPDPGRRQATGLLVAVAAVFVAIQMWGGDATWVGYLEATVAAGMVGGLADWFAVTALFRRPLRLPIPHTAIIVERKDAFGRTLGDFVQTSFLTPDIIAERVRAAEVVSRLAAWLSEPDNAARLARHVADAAVTAADLLRDEEVHARWRTPPAGASRPPCWPCWPAAPAGHDRGRPPPRPARRGAAGRRPVPDREPRQPAARFRRRVAVVAARRGRGPHLRASAHRRPHGAGRGGPQPRPRAAGRRRRPGQAPRPGSADRRPPCGRGASSSSTSCCPSPSCGRGWPRCGATSRAACGHRRPTPTLELRRRLATRSSAWASGCATTPPSPTGWATASRPRCATWPSSSATRSAPW